MKMMKIMKMIKMMKMKMSSGKCYLMIKFIL